MPRGLLRWRLYLILQAEPKTGRQVTPLRSFSQERLKLGHVAVMEAVLDL